jgi:hypothetical protein
MNARILIAAVIAVILPAAAVAQTQTEREACVNDAFRVCWSAMPDRHNVFVCLAKNNSQLSGACREVMARYSSHSRRAQWSGDLHGQEDRSNRDQDP